MKKENLYHKDLEKSSKWMLTFSDMSTLLLTFFVMIVGISLVPEKKIREIFMINPPEKTNEYPSEARIFNPIEGIPITTITKDEIELIDNLSKLYEDYKGKGNVSLFSEYRKVKLIVSEKLLFPPGQYKLSKSAYKVIDQVYSILKDKKYFILIEGHTDSSISKKISNMELSLKRAISVAEYLIKKGYPKDKITVCGYGDSKPLYPEDTLSGRAKNRRVEVTIFLKR